MSDIRDKIKRQIELLGMVLNDPERYKIVDFEKNVKAVSTFTLKVQSNKSDDLILSITGSYEILLITDGDIPKSFWNVYKVDFVIFPQS